MTTSEAPPDEEIISKAQPELISGLLTVNVCREPFRVIVDFSTLYLHASHDFSR